MAAVSRVLTTFEAKPASVPIARQMVSDQLEVAVAPEIRDPVLLLASELVTNAVLHAGRPFAVFLVVRNDAVRVEVHDPSARPPTIRTPQPGDTGGRGLHVIDALASRWGYDRTPDGKIVWFEVDR
jgi:anti-sigma regulatory factor (Ser/Thr protein kinase)